MSWPAAFVAVALIAAFTLLVFTGHCENPVSSDVACIRAGGTWVRAPGCQSDYCQKAR